VRKWATSLLKVARESGTQRHHDDGRLVIGGVLDRGHHAMGATLANSARSASILDFAWSVSGDDEAYTAIAGLLCPLSNLPWRWTT